MSADDDKTRRVTAQRSRAGRWAYVLRTPGEFPFVSHHRYGSEAAALAAGQTDAEACDAMAAAERLDDPPAGG